MSFWNQVSVVMIALNAEDLLPAALQSVPKAAEIILADGGSVDRTTQIARSNGARVVQQDLASIAEAGGNFDVARNAAAELSTRDWVLFLDCDERLSAELVAEIESFSSDGLNFDAYEISRVNLFWGKPVRLLGEDFQTRLVRKGKGCFVGKALHQKLKIEGLVGQLDSPMIHVNIRSWRDVVMRFKRYIPIEARTYSPDLPLRSVVATPYFMFRHYYFRNGSWRDGYRGFLVSAVYALYHGAVAWAARRAIHA